MFSFTFLLLLYAKFCHGSSSLHGNQENGDGITRSRSGLSGIEKTVIESLPFFRFSSLRGSREGLECSVCLSKFEDVEVLRLLPKCKHAFHINCVDQWLEKHSSCPLCRRKVNADDVVSFTNSNSSRFLRNQSSLRDDSNSGLFVQREEDRSRGSRHGSFRFSNRISFRNVEKKEEELPIQASLESEENDLHKFNHKIIVSDHVALKNRWSSVSSSDLLFLNSEMVNAITADRFSSLDSNHEPFATAKVIKDGEIMKIKEEMERKRVFESKINRSDFESKVNLSHTSKVLNPSEKRSMSEITVHPRFRDFSVKNGSTESSLPENNVEEDRTRRLWLPIARRTVQWFANRERNLQSHRRQSLNV